jgi:adenine phosphoribosyltransferase
MKRGDTAAAEAEMAAAGAEAEMAALVASRIVDVPDFPQPGIVFKDLSPLFGDAAVFRAVVDEIVRAPGSDGFEAVVGIEARGFVLASAAAYAAGVGVVPVRKAGKLPRETYAASYALEYGEATLEVHRDAFSPGQRVLVVDDVLATGGTAAASLELVERAGARVTGFTVLVELSFLSGRDRLPGRPVRALLTV